MRVNVETLKSIWRTSLNKSDSFIERFFSDVYEQEFLHYIDKDGEIACVLYALPYSFNYHGAILKTTYIYGVSTLPKYQDLNLIPVLLENTFSYLKEKGESVFAFTIPSNNSLLNTYQECGFRKMFYYQTKYFLYRVRQNGDKDSQFLKVSEGYDHKVLFDFFNKIQYRRLCCPLLSFKQWEFQVKDIICEGGDVFILKQKDSIMALAFAFPYMERIIVKDIFSENENAGKLLLHNMASHFNMTGIFNKRPLMAKNIFRDYPLGMMKEINRKFSASFSNNKEDAFLGLMMD